MNPYARFLLAALCGGCVLIGPLRAQVAEAPRERVQFAASASLEAAQDILSVTLRSVREGSEALAVQQRLQADLDAALTQARAAARPQALEVRTGAFSLSPRYGRDGRLAGWQGQAELVLSGRDFERIATLAARLPGLSVAAVAFSLSREQRERLEAQAQAQAIARFRARASEIAQAFGFAGYVLGEVQIVSQELGPPGRPHPVLLQARSSAEEAMPLPVEAALATVQVTVSGTVQLK